MKAGIYQDISNAEYHGKIDALSASGLKLLAKSPAHYRNAIDNPPEQTPAMAFGSAFHSYFLEPDNYAAQYALMPEGIDRRTKAGKAEYAAFLDEAKGKVVISRDDEYTLESMHLSAYQSETVRGIMSNMRAEQTVIWDDPLYGFLCKTRPDIDCPLIGVLADLKTCEDASPKGFARACANFGYHLQAAWYLDGWNIVAPVKYRTFLFIAIEKKPPHAVAVYEADAEFIEKGREQNKQLRALYHQCYSNDNWPGYGDRVQTLSLPAWA